MSEDMEKDNNKPENDPGSAADHRLTEDEKMNTLTTRQGHVVRDNQNIRTVGNRGPSTLENYEYIEKI